MRPFPARWRHAALLALAFLYGPVLRDLVGVWYRGNYYSYGFLIAPLSAWMMVRARPALAVAAPLRDPLGLALTVAGLATLALGHALDSLTLAALSLPVVLGGLGCFVLGRAGVRPLVFPLATLALMAPLPPSAVPPLSWQLQNLAARFTAAVLSALDIPFSRDGVFVHLESVIVHVSEACNGLRFLLAMLVVGMAFAWAASHRLVERSVVILLGLAAAIGGNLVRVSSTAVMVHWWGPSASEGLFHSLFGKTVYCAVVVLFFLTVRGLSRRKASSVAGAA